jgi:biopolymer transport protein TolR
VSSAPGEKGRAGVRYPRVMQDLARKHSRGFSARKPLAAINVTPLVDVLLILLVIVMLAMPAFVKKLPVELPRTGLESAPAAVNSLRIAVAADGAVFVETRPATLAQVKELIQANTTIELSVDVKTPYGVAAQLIARLQESNPKEIVLATI